MFNFQFHHIKIYILVIPFISTDVMLLPNGKKTIKILLLNSLLSFLSLLIQTTENLINLTNLNSIDKIKFLLIRPHF